MKHKYKEHLEMFVRAWKEIKIWKGKKKKHKTRSLYYKIYCTSQILEQKIPKGCDWSLPCVDIGQKV